MLKRLDIAVGHFDVADRSVLGDKVLNGLLTAIGFRLRVRFLRFLNLFYELLERFFQNFGGDFPAFDSDSDNLCVYFILHGNLLSEICRRMPGLRRHTPKVDCSEHGISLLPAK